MASLIKLEKGQYLFHEGDPSDAMYVIKSGRIAIIKSSIDTEIILAELGSSSMLGEMAFFDNKPRSASAKALQNTTVIALPFKALHTQFLNFPEWTKAIMKTVNDHLREANKRIKALEKLSNKEEKEIFPPYLVNKLISIINLVGNKFGEKKNDILILPFEKLRKFTIQIFGLPTHKMQKILEILQEINLLKIEKIEDGKQNIHIFDSDLLFKFVDWYNNWLFEQEDKKITIYEEELRLLKALIYFAEKIPSSHKEEEISISLTKIQNESMKELNELVKIDDMNSLINKKIIGEKIMEEDGIYSSFNLYRLKRILPFWEIIYKIQKHNR